MTRFYGDSSKWFRVDVNEIPDDHTRRIKHATHWCYTLPQALELANAYVALMPTYRLLGWAGYEVRAVDLLFAEEVYCVGKIFEEKENENEDHQE